jgi:hypothetical protein
VKTVARKLNEKALRAEIEATFHEHFRERRDELVSWVRLLPQASTPEEFMRMQLELRDRFAARQDAMKVRRHALIADKAERARLAPLKPQPRAEMQELRRRIVIRERLHLRDTVLQHISRCLADAMVWRATGYDRALFTVLGNGERVGRFPDESGAKIERDRAQEIWNQGALPFFNDLTNCLRQGDLTVLHSAWPDAHVAIDEVKRSGRANPNSRQGQRLDCKLKLLNTEWDPIGADGKPLALWRLPLPYRHALDTLAAVLAEARRDGHAHVQLHPAIVISATDINWAISHPAQAGNWTMRAAEDLGWTPQDARHFSSSALTTRMRERRHAGSAFHAPVAIFPLCAEDVVDILMGSLDYNVTLRVDALLPAFTARRIDVDFATGHDADRTFLRARRSGDDVIVPAHLREQMLRELMTVDTLVDIVDTLLDGARLGAPPDVTRIVTCDERLAWPRPPMYLTP